MLETIEEKCLSKGVKLTDKRRIMDKVMKESSDHTDVDELYNRVSKIDNKISIATGYRTVKLIEKNGGRTPYGSVDDRKKCDILDDVEPKGKATRPYAHVMKQ